MDGRVLGVLMGRLVARAGHRLGEGGDIAHATHSLAEGSRERGGGGGRLTDGKGGNSVSCWRRGGAGVKVGGYLVEGDGLEGMVFCFLLFCFYLGGGRGGGGGGERWRSLLS